MSSFFWGAERKPMPGAREEWRRNVTGHLGTHPAEFTGFCHNLDFYSESNGEPFRKVP